MRRMQQEARQGWQGSLLDRRRADRVPFMRREAPESRGARREEARRLDGVGRYRLGTSVGCAWTHELREQWQYLSCGREIRCFDASVGSTGAHELSKQRQHLASCEDRTHRLCLAELCQWNRQRGCRSEYSTARWNLSLRCTSLGDDCGAGVECRSSASPSAERRSQWLHRCCYSPSYCLVAASGCGGDNHEYRGINE